MLRALLAFLLAEAHDPSIAREQLARAARHDLAPSNFRLAVELLSAGAELVLALRAGQIGAPEARARASGLLERASPDALRAADGSGEAISDVRLAARLIERWVEERVEPPVVLVARDGRSARTARFGDVDLARRPLLGRLLLWEPTRDVAVDELLEAGWPGEKMVGTSGVRRLQVAINRLRDLGLRDVVETVEGGYRIAEPWRVEIADATSVP